MPTPLLITGQAGTGKTTELLRQLAENRTAAQLQPHQRVLAMAVMHGARNRLDNGLCAHRQCRSLRRTVTTIDSFALDIASKWRLSRGIQLPIAPCRENSANSERNFRCHLAFNEILTTATELLRAACVGTIIGNTYPVVLIDEFQDCDSAHLALVEELASHCQLLLAADEFQLLEASDEANAAVEWAKRAAGQSNTITLLRQHRFQHNTGILAAAHCLRENVSSINETVPVRYGGVPQLAWKIIDQLVLSRARPKTFALISPTRDPVVRSVLESVDSQLKSRGLRGISWNHFARQEDQERLLFQNLGVDSSESTAIKSWSGPHRHDAEHVREVSERVHRFAKLRGIKTIPCDLVIEFAQQIIHAYFSYSPPASRNVVTTVHGAKNREFECVFVVWPHSAQKDEILSRRLLYNAVTRASRTCVVFAIRGERDTKNDRLLQLLGPAKPIFAPRPKKSSRK